MLEPDRPAALLDEQERSRKAQKRALGLLSAYLYAQTPEQQAGAGELLDEYLFPISSYVDASIPDPVEMRRAWGKQARKVDPQKLRDVVADELAEHRRLILHVLGFAAVVIDLSLGLEEHDPAAVEPSLRVLGELVEGM